MGRIHRRGIARKECPFPFGAIPKSAVREVLPDGPVCFQVDQNADLAPLLIGHKLNSGHGSIFLQVPA